MSRSFFAIASTSAAQARSTWARSARAVGLRTLSMSCSPAAGSGIACLVSRRALEKLVAMNGFLRCCDFDGVSNGLRREHCISKRTRFELAGAPPRDPDGGTLALAVPLDPPVSHFEQPIRQRVVLIVVTDDEHRPSHGLELGQDLEVEDRLEVRVLVRRPLVEK